MISTATTHGDTATRCPCTSKRPAVGEIVHSVEAHSAFARDHGAGRYDVNEHPSTGFKHRRSRRGREAR